MSLRSGNILNSSINRSAATTITTSTMHHHTRRSFQVNETIEEEVDTPKAENENVTTTTPPLKRHTPILFSTNRGLHLRTTNTSNNNNTARTTPHTIHSSVSATSALQHSSSRNSNSSTLINSLYNITFCDLERWSTNRANTISLEDTFTIPKPAVVPSSAASGSLASTSLRFLPHKATTTSVRFNGYSRFDVE